MYYTVYKITNVLNNKIYIGVHKTTDLDDSYMGSGKYLKNSIKRHGIENFKKEYIAVFDNPDDMFNMESELVNEEFVKSSSSYNIVTGGRGGHFDLCSLGGKAYTEMLKNNIEYAAIHSARSSIMLKKTHASGKIKYGISFKGRSHSDETKAKIGTANSIKQQGNKNSQFGSMWITDRVSNKKISKDGFIPDGWMKGRV